MEKRFILFIVLTMLLLTGHALVRSWLLPPPPLVEQVQLADEPQELEGPAGPDSEPGEAVAPADDQPATDQQTDDQQPADDPQPSAELWAGPEPSTADLDTPARRLTLGSYNGSSLLVTLNSRGAAVERVELTERKESGELKYLNLDDQSGYLGHLALTVAEEGGCRINVVGAETPAAVAGLQVDDVITEIDGQLVRDPQQIEALLHATKPGTPLDLSVRRRVTEQETVLPMTVVLGTRPFQIIQPEPLEPEEVAAHPLSYLMSLIRVGALEASQDQSEVLGLASLRTGIWQVAEVAEPRPAVEFRFLVDNLPGGSGSLEVIKRFRLGLPTDLDAESQVSPYHLIFELEIVNHGEEAQQISYRLDGPNGLPLEGWWYSHKIHPRMFGAAGARDVIVHAQVGGLELYGASAIYKTATKNQMVPTTAVLAEDDEAAHRTLGFMGVDTQYFLAALLPDLQAQAPVEDYEFRRGEALALGDLAAKDKGKIRTTNVSFQLDSQPIEIGGGDSVSRRFLLFSGPKKPELLAAYGLDDAIYYGWFGVVSKPLSSILHFFYWLIGNYGLAIIMLTVLVRSCMFPISRKAAKNAAMMQELAPEMKKITEKYNEMDKRAKAQQELFRKNNYNPLSGCWLMFLQLPIFLGLYRALSVDIELRQASLIPGVAWCSNLAGPDKLLYWENDFWGLFTETGMLGPYFNVLPIITIGMFLVHQKLFMPPATDDQTRMQLKMMKFMMIFMGFMFFKVAAGLCLYFIASSLWGIAERKLLPKSSKASADQGLVSQGKGSGGPSGGNPRKPPPPRPKPPAGGTSNGSSAKRPKPKRNKRR